MLTQEETAILNRDYSRRPSTREGIQRYRGLVRGDIRLSRGLIRTEREYEHFIQAGLALKLPGQK